MTGFPIPHTEKRLIVVEPGTHHLTETLVIPENTVVDGNGAHLVFPEGVEICITGPKGSEIRNATVTRGKIANGDR
jgi:hypothetical protein